MMTILKLESWVSVPGETNEIKMEFGARVLNIFEVPDYEFEVPPDVDERDYIVQIGYPTKNFGPQIPMLYTAVIGNIANSGKLKLIDLNFPKEYVKGFKGPKFGIEGLREILNIPERPFVNNMLNIALPKGRLGDSVYSMLDKAGFDCPAYNDINRELVIENTKKGLRYLLVKPGDVQVYVEHHAADVGIVGKDILLETEPDVYELLDLGIGKCRMCVAAPRGFTDDRSSTLRVATKYVNVAKHYYSERNRDMTGWTRDLRPVSSILKKSTSEI